MGAVHYLLFGQCAVGVVRYLLFGQCAVGVVRYLLFGQCAVGAVRYLLFGQCAVEGGGPFVLLSVREEENQGHLTGAPEPTLGQRHQTGLPVHGHTHTGDTGDTAGQPGGHGSGCTPAKEVT